MEAAGLRHADRDAFFPRVRGKYPERSEGGWGRGPCGGRGATSGATTYIFSGAEIPRMPRTARRVLRAASTSHRRAWVSAGSSVTMRQSA